MESGAIRRLAESIGYPEKVAAGLHTFVFRVDGMEITAEEADGRVVLSIVLTDDESKLPTLASYAAGRMLREDAVLSWGEKGAFIWQDVPSDASSRDMLMSFETFMNSCDWWRARLDVRQDGGSPAPVPEAMMIRP